jgi:hypothetical protein
LTPRWAFITKESEFMRGLPAKGDVMHNNVVAVFTAVCLGLLCACAQADNPVHDGAKTSRATIALRNMSQPEDGVAASPAETPEEECARKTNTGRQLCSASAACTLINGGTGGCFWDINVCHATTATSCGGIPPNCTGTHVFIDCN